jgi:protein-L-isoaspartate(D-aspartate) O-methyltransferase
MDRASELAIVRRAYAKQILAEAQVADSRVEAAFAAVPREDFLGSGPWLVYRFTRGYTPTPSADPVYIYTDNLVALIAERSINNGQPSLHAKLIASAGINDGDHVVHIGTGSGYYTAIMSQLAGRSGRVTGIEFDPELAARARANLASFDNVQIVQGDGATARFDAANVIYVNAGATRPAEAWLDNLLDGGRLIVMLTSNSGFKHNPAELPIERRGAVFRIVLQKDEFLAQWIGPVAVYPCESTRDAMCEAALAEALGRGGWERVTRLYRSADIPEERCWLRAPGWSLAYS